MVSGGASIMGVPWEIVIKTFREELKSRRSNTIDEYCDRFFSFVDQFPFEAEAETQYIGQIARSIFSQLREWLDSWVNQELSGKDTVTDAEILAYLQSQIREASLFFAHESENRGILDDNTQKQILDKYRTTFDDLIKIFFEKYSLPEEDQTKLHYIVIHAANINPKNLNVSLPIQKLLLQDSEKKNIFHIVGPTMLRGWCQGVQFGSRASEAIMMLGQCKMPQYSPLPRIMRSRRFSMAFPRFCQVPWRKSFRRYLAMEVLCRKNYVTILQPNLNFCKRNKMICETRLDASVRLPTRPPCQSSMKKAENGIRIPFYKRLVF